MTRREPTIPIEDVEKRAREVLGDTLVKLTCKPRKGRSERITLHVPGGTFTFTNDSYADRDAVRRGVLAFLDDCMTTANETVARVLECPECKMRGQCKLGCSRRKGDGA